VEKRKEQLGDTRQAGAKKKLGEWTDDDDDLLSLWNSELLINKLLVGVYGVVMFFFPEF